MTNEIIDGILRKLSNAFSEEYTIYTEDVEQGLKEPCFFVFCMTQEVKKILGKRYLKENQFCIQFLPEETEYSERCNSIAQKLFYCLEYIDLEGSLIQGTKMSAEIQDNVLSFFVNYNVFIFIEEEKEKMKKLKIK